MRCIALHHVRFEDLGGFAAPIERAGYQVSYRHAGGAPLSACEWTGADLVVVLGGPLGVGDAHAYPWLGAEIGGLARRLAHGMPTLGICLGAQLMAAALGGGVLRRSGTDGASGFEIGWAPLTGIDPAGPLAALDGVPVLHWHGDNIVLPAGLAPLAATPGTPCQAFAAGTHALALQFHAEFDAAAIEEWLSGHAVELAQARVDLHALRGATALHGARLAAAGGRLIERWLSGFAPS